MDLETLKRVVRGRESDRVEFKQTTGQRGEAARTACAMLNGVGGTILFGVSPQGQILGQQVGSQTLEDVAAELARIEPQAFPAIETIALEGGRAVIAVHVPGGGGLYTIGGSAYVRHGSVTRKMSGAEYERRVMEKLHGVTRWETTPVAKGVGIRDLDGTAVRETIAAAVQLGRLKSLPRRDLISMLMGMGLIRDGKLLNAAVALYGKSHRLQIYYPQLMVRMARFKGMDRLGGFADNRQAWGHAFDLLRQSEQFFSEHNPIAGRLVSGRVKREDRSRYQPLAFREAIANALCHRDYTYAGDAISVGIYDDRVEIASPGGLHFGLKTESLTRPHESRPWNPIMANVFYLAGIIEMWGSGTLNILDHCRDGHSPPPTWGEENNYLYITFRPAASLSSSRRLRSARNRQRTSGLGSRLESGLESRLESGLESRLESEVARKILAAVADMPLSRGHIAQALRHRTISGTIHRTLDSLLKAGLVARTIPNKPNSRLQKYKLTDKGRRHAKS